MTLEKSFRQQVNIKVDANFAEAWDRIANQYGHKKEKGMVTMAMILMFLEADAETRAEFVERIAVAQVKQELPGLVDDFLAGEDVAGRIREAAPMHKKAAQPPQKRGRGPRSK